MGGSRGNRGSRIVGRADNCQVCHCGAGIIGCAFNCRVGDGGWGVRWGKRREAILRKRVIKLIKDLSAKELLAYLHCRGYNGVAVSNAAKREKHVYEILQGEKQ